MKLYKQLLAYKNKVPTKSTRLIAYIIHLSIIFILLPIILIFSVVLNILFDEVTAAYYTLSFAIICLIDAVFCYFTRYILRNPAEKGTFQYGYMSLTFYLETILIPILLIASIVIIITKGIVIRY